jgi:hypothetical protein
MVVFHIGECFFLAFQKLRVSSACLLCSDQINPSEADRKRENCAFGELLINRQWPVAFMYLLGSNVPKNGTELEADYGDNYWFNYRREQENELRLRRALKASCGPIVIDD